MDKIAVFCGSGMGFNPVYRAMAGKLARVLIENNITLVYGGANVGLMKILADTMISYHREVIGVIPQSIVDKEVAHYGISTLHIVSSMAERKKMMAEISDAFIAMPGGFGTLDELAELITYNQLRIHDKPIGILNTNGYFNHLISFLNHGVTEGFIRKEHSDNIIIAEEPADLLLRLRNYKPVEVEKWISDLKEESGHS